MNGLFSFDDGDVCEESKVLKYIRIYVCICVIRKAAE